MPRPFATVAAVQTPEGRLELRARGEGDFLITIAGRVLMTSSARRSEEALATLGCRDLGGKPDARVLVGGLGMAYTLRAALDVLPAGAEVVVAELHAEVAQWCRGPLARLTAGAVLDPRVHIQLGDVAAAIAAAPPGTFDAILLDLFEGPAPIGPRREDPLYGARAIGRAHAALSPGGTFAIWGESDAPAFTRRLREGGFEVELHRAGRGGRRHVIWVATRSTRPGSRRGR